MNGQLDLYPKVGPTGIFLRGIKSAVVCLLMCFQVSVSWSQTNCNQSSFSYGYARPNINQQLSADDSQQGLPFTCVSASGINSCEHMSQSIPVSIEHPGLKTDQAIIDTLSAPMKNPNNDRNAPHHPITPRKSHKSLPSTLQAFPRASPPGCNKPKAYGLPELHSINRQALRGLPALGLLLVD